MAQKFEDSKAVAWVLFVLTAGAMCLFPALLALLSLLAFFVRNVSGASGTAGLVGLSAGGLLTLLYLLFLVRFYRAVARGILSRRAAVVSWSISIVGQALLTCVLLVFLPSLVIAILALPLPFLAWFYSVVTRGAATSRFALLGWSISAGYYAILIFLFLLLLQGNGLLYRPLGFVAGVCFCVSVGQLFLLPKSPGLSKRERLF